MIELGKEVKCKITGLRGIAVARTVFINGCVQYEVQPKAKDNKMPESIGIDEDSLEELKTKKKAIRKSTNGGPNKSVSRRNW